MICLSTVKYLIGVDLRMWVVVFYGEKALPAVVEGEFVEVDAGAGEGADAGVGAGCFFDVLADEVLWFWLVFGDEDVGESGKAVPGKREYIVVG